MWYEMSGTMPTKLSHHWTCYNDATNIVFSILLVIQIKFVVLLLFVAAPLHQI